MRKIETTPAACLVCGAGNTPGKDGERREFVDLERDVNWNDPAIICGDCLFMAGGLVGMLSPDALEKMKRELRAKDEELHASKVEMDQMKKRARRLGVEFAKAS